MGEDALPKRIIRPSKEQLPICGRFDVGTSFRLGTKTQKVEAQDDNENMTVEKLGIECQTQYRIDTQYNKVPSSRHPNHVKNSIGYSQTIRIPSVCNDDVTARKRTAG